MGLLKFVIGLIREFKQFLFIKIRNVNLWRYLLI